MKIASTVYNTIYDTISKTKSTLYWALNWTLTSVKESNTSDTSVKEETINNKPVIIIDVDGVILDFAAGFRYWWNIEKQYRKKYNHTVPDNPSDWHFEFKGDCKIIYSKLTQYINTKPMLSLFDMTIPQSLRELRKHFKIIIVTAYPYRESRIKNLELYGIRMANGGEYDGEYGEYGECGGEYDELHCCYRDCKVTKITSFKDIAFIVEDCPDHVTELVKRGYTVYAPSHWNYLCEVFTKYENNKGSFAGTLINYQRFDHVANVEIQLKTLKPQNTLKSEHT